MPTITIGDQKVTVGDEFMKLAPEQQNATVDEIAKALPKKEAAPQRGVVDKLFGIGGERYQTWPERAVRGVVSSVGEAVESGAELTKKAMTGQYGPTGEGILEESPARSSRRLLSALAPRRRRRRPRAALSIPR